MSTGPPPPPPPLTVNWSDDPGWCLGKTLPLALPVIGRLRMDKNRREGRGDPLIDLRATFISFTVSLVVFGVVIAFVGHMPPGSGASIAIVLGWAVVAVALMGRLERDLDCSSLAALGSTYRQRYFLRVAFSNSIALVAFVLTFVTGPIWIYYPGAAIALALLFLRASPSPAALQREQDALNASGCGLSLVAAVRTRVPA